MQGRRKVSGSRKERGKEGEKGKEEPEKGRETRWERKREKKKWGGGKETGNYGARDRTIYI